MATFTEKYLNLEDLCLKLVLRSGFCYMLQHLWRTITYYEMPNNDNSSDIMINNSEMWQYQTQFNLKATNGKQTIKIQSIKHQNIKKARLSTSPTNLYATKLLLQSKQKIEIELPKVTNGNTKATWTNVTQIY